MRLPFLDSAGPALEDLCLVTADRAYLRNWKLIHLVFHNPEIANIESTLLEGDYPTRRTVYCGDVAAIDAKQADLERVIGDLVGGSGEHQL
jgi:hypothetical protein